MNRSELYEQYQTVRATTEKLIAPLEKEDTVVQPILDVSPPKWHLGHTAWFFETFLLEPSLQKYRVFHPKYTFLFNSYYDHVGERVDRPKRGFLSRPTLEEILTYRHAVDKAMGELIDQCPKNKWLSIHDLIELGLNHEQQHQELLLTDIKYILGHNPLFPAYTKQPKSQPPQNPVKHEFVMCRGGVFTVGHAGAGFHYDNECPNHEVLLQDFALQNQLVTNGDFLAFVQDGGYTDFRHWLSDGWDTLQQHQWQAPEYWVKDEGQWYEYTLYGLEPLNLRAPVCHISFYEAEAYASWSGKRLPTEAEWEVAANRHQTTDGPTPNLLECDTFHPEALKPDENSHLHQLIGDVWEWTSSSYLPYPGYRHTSDALGEYNGKFMINQMVLKGGSCVTPLSHIRLSYRNFFHADKRWQFTGLRLAD
jgi:ergothioneine biosynthesis protein EgtB